MTVDGWLAEYVRDPAEALAQLRDLALAWSPVAAPAMLALACAFLAVRGWWRRRVHARFARDARLVTVLAPPRVDPAGAGVLWSNLHGLLCPRWRRLLNAQPHLSFEYAWDGATLRVRMWVPGPVPPGLIERAVEAAWPGARTHSSPTASDEPASPAAIGGALRLARPEVLPLRTDHDVDPARALLGALAGLPPDHTACVQVLARPVTGTRLVRARRSAVRLRTSATARPVSRLLDALTPGGHHRPATAARGGIPADPDRPAQARAVAEKLAQPCWETTVRYLITGGVDAHAQMRGRAHAVASAFAVFAGRNHFRRRRLRNPATVMASRRFHRGDLLSVPELAALAHLPLDAMVPGLVGAGARAVPPPPVVPTGGHDVKRLGIADAGVRRPVGLTTADARHHLQVIGATGAGKSTLLARMILSDIEAHRAVVVIDPKGDLITDLLDRLPGRGTDRLVLIDPDAAAHPVLNVLDPGDNPAMAVDNLVGIFGRIFHGYWGPRTDDVFRSALLTLVEAAPVLPEPPSLADIPRLLTDPAWRALVLRGVTDAVLRGFWAGYHETGDGTRAHAIAPLQNKLRAFLLRPFVRHTVAGGPSTIDMPALLDSGGIVLARLPKGQLGEDTVRLLGSFLVARVWQAAQRRARQPEPARRDAALYIDECHNFLTLPYATQDMLVEARGYRLSLVLAHQNLAQLPRELREGISTNARNKIVFNVSPEDAHDLERHTAPHLGAHDLTHLDAFHAAARLLVAAQSVPAFTFQAEPLPPQIPGQANRLRRRPALSTEPTVHTVVPDASRLDPRRRPEAKPA